VVVFAASAGLSLYRRWPAVLGATAVATGAQALWLFFVANDGDAGAIAVGAAFFVVLLSAAVGRQHTSTGSAMDGLAGSLALAAAAVALIGSLTVFASASHAGWALLVAAALLAGACGVTRGPSRDLAALFGGLALTVAAVATADLLSNRSLTLVWAAEA